MEYSIQRLARMSGISTRTLRYYDQIGLLCPARLSSNGYRIYGQREIDLLQQILFYRELGVPLEEIRCILSAPDFDRARALQQHLISLQQKKCRLEALIHNVTETIHSMKEGTPMNDIEKFEGFKQAALDKNEAQYGREAREKYGSDAVEGSYAKFRGMSPEQWNTSERLRTEYESLLKTAFAEGDPASADAQKMCDLHRQWLCTLWKEGTYTPAAQLAMGEMYAGDARFRSYYDKIVPGCVDFLRDALRIYCKA